MRIVRNNAGYIVVVADSGLDKESGTVEANLLYELLETSKAILAERTTIPYQKCPVCDGTGLVSRPTNIAGDVGTFSSSHITYECKICNGKGIIKEGKP